MDFHHFYLKRRGRVKGDETGSGFEEEVQVFDEKRGQGDLVME